MAKAKKVASGEGKGFKLQPKPGVKPILAALNIKSARVEGGKLILKIGKVEHDGSPMGKQCTFTAPACTLHKVFKKVGPSS